MPSLLTHGGRSSPWPFMFNLEQWGTILWEHPALMSEFRFCFLCWSGWPQAFWMPPPNRNHRWWKWRAPKVSERAIKREIERAIKTVSDQIDRISSLGTSRFCKLVLCALAYATGHLPVRPISSRPRPCLANHNRSLIMGRGWYDDCTEECQWEHHWGLFL